MEDSELIVGFEALLGAMGEDQRPRILAWLRARIGAAPPSAITPEFVAAYLDAMTVCPVAVSDAIRRAVARKDLHIEGTPAVATAPVPPRRIDRWALGRFEECTQPYAIIVSWKCGCGNQRVHPVTAADMGTIASGQAPHGWTMHEDSIRLNVPPPCHCHATSSVHVYASHARAFIERRIADLDKTLREGPGQILEQMWFAPSLGQKGPQVQNIPGQLLPSLPSITDPGKTWIRDDQSSSAKPVNYGWHDYSQTVPMPVEGSALNGPRVTSYGDVVKSTAMGGVGEGRVWTLGSNSVLASIPEAYREGMGDVGGVFK